MSTKKTEFEKDQESESFKNPIWQMAAEVADMEMPYRLSDFTNWGTGSVGIMPADLPAGEEEIESEEAKCFRIALINAANPNYR